MVRPPAKPLVSGARLAPELALDLNGLLESPGWAALERTRASCKRSTPEVAPLEVRAMVEFSLEPAALLESALSFSAPPVLLMFERNKLGLETLGFKLGKIAVCDGFGASNGERCLRVMTCEDRGLLSVDGGLSVRFTGLGNGLDTTGATSGRTSRAVTLGGTRVGARGAGVATFALGF